MESGIVQLNIDTDTSTISCNLLHSYLETVNVVCSITYGYPPGNCDMFTDSSHTTTGRPGINLTIPLSQNVNNGENFCYTVSLKYGLTPINIVGSFVSGKACKLYLLNQTTY